MTWLVVLVGVQLSVYGWLVFLSRAFDFEAETWGRPIPLVVSLLGLNFLLHLISLWLALKLPKDRRLWMVVLLPALAFRGTLLLSYPIQEVDIYRYCWDGAVMSEGVSPFRYSPWRIQNAFNAQPANVFPGHDAEEVKLIRLRDADPGLAKALSRVHYTKLTTIYPPISQLVFALADRTTPVGASLATRLLVMKSWIVAFDFATAVLVGALLTTLGQHIAWVIPYAWSPLIMKEFANSGHLDSIAVFFAVLSVWLLVLRSDKSQTSHLLWVSSALCLALGVGAKLFPVVLLPICVSLIWKRFSVVQAAGYAVTVLLAASASLAPMLFSERVRNDAPASTAPRAAQFQEAQSTPALSLPPPPPPSETEASPLPALPIETAGTGFGMGASTEEELDFALPPPPEAKPVKSKLANEDGLVEFLSRWEMNDLLFMVVQENVRPSTKEVAWFVFMPISARTWIDRNFQSLSALGGLRDPVPAKRSSFLLTRLLTLLVCGLVILQLCWRIVTQSKSSESRTWSVESNFLDACFLALAWFWFLAPTQNPWYWAWALPFVCFARNRWWLAVAGLSLIYYLRFWLSYQYAEVDIGGLGYVGVSFFDYILVWLEFGPFLVVLAITALLQARDG